MNEAYQLTERELTIFQDQEFMPLKAIVWTKLEGLLKQLQENLNKIIPQYITWLPEELVRSSGKISRGENYKTYSYRVLDYPRVFSGGDIFTFRCVILWGHMVGFHLILSGKYKRDYQERILANALQVDKEIWLSILEDPWVWEFEEENFLSVKQTHHSQIITQAKELDFLKLSLFIPSENYQHIPELGTTIFQKLLN